MKVKFEKDVKPKPEPPTPAKRPRTISAELSTAKRLGTVTRQQARVLEDMAADEDNDEFPDLEQLVDLAEGSGGEDTAA